MLVYRGIFGSILALLAVSLAHAQVGSFSGGYANRDTNGWTIPPWTVGNSGTNCNNKTTSTWNGTCINYVDSTNGNDITCAPEAATQNPRTQTPTTPCKSVRQAVQNSRKGAAGTFYDDWIALVAGGSWTNDSFVTVNPTGKSCTRPYVIASYGTGARPVLHVAKASIERLVILGGGSGGAQGTYPGITVTGNTTGANSAVATVVVGVGGNITAIYLTDGGYDYGTFENVTLSGSMGGVSGHSVRVNFVSSALLANSESNLIVQDIEWHGYQRDPNNAAFSLARLQAGSFLDSLGITGNDTCTLYEGTKVSWALGCFANIGGNSTLSFPVGTFIRGFSGGIHLRRVTCMSNGFSPFNTGQARASGLFAQGVSGMLVEESFFDSGGWQADLSRQTVTIAPGSPCVITYPQGQNFMPPGTDNVTLAVSSGGTLPCGLSVYPTQYFLVNPSGNTAQLATSQGGAAINNASTGSGTITGVWGGIVNATSHQYYYNETSYSMTFRGNVSTRGASTGFQQRHGGPNDNNFYAYNAVGLGTGLFGANVTNNVCVENGGLAVVDTNATSADCFIIAGSFPIDLYTYTNVPIPRVWAAFTVDNNIAANSPSATGSGFILSPFSQTVWCADAATLTNNIVYGYNGHGIADNATGCPINVDVTSQGSGYADGYYTAVKMASVSGTPANPGTYANVAVGGGKIQSVQVVGQYPSIGNDTRSGLGCVPNDAVIDTSLSAGSGHAVTVTSVSPNFGAIVGYSFTPGTGYAGPLSTSLSAFALVSGGRSNATLTWAANVVTLTTSVPHGYANGALANFSVLGATPSGYNVSNVTATVTGASTITYSKVGDPGANSVPGTFSTCHNVSGVSAVPVTGPVVAVDINPFDGRAEQGGGGNGTAQGCCFTVSQTMKFNSDAELGGGSGFVGTVTSIAQNTVAGSNTVCLTAVLSACTPANPSFPSPANATIEQYDLQKLGGPGTLAHYWATCGGQSRSNWNPLCIAPKINDFMRAQFGRPPVPWPPATWLLRRDLDPASNDNTPSGLPLAA